MNKRRALTFLLGSAMMVVGSFHFITPEPFIKIVPAYLPPPNILVVISGFFEILGGLGLIISKTRRFASWGLIALYISVFPANINMALNDIHLSEDGVANWVYWLRLPFQFVFIYLAWWVGKKKAPSDDQISVSNSSE